MLSVLDLSHHDSREKLDNVLHKLKWNDFPGLQALLLKVTKTVMQILQNLKSHGIDLFTDTTAILNLLDLGSIMGCPGRTRSVFTRAFRAKRELQCIFLWKRRLLLHPNTAQQSFFLITIFF